MKIIKNIISDIGSTLELNSYSTYHYEYLENEYTISSIRKNLYKDCIIHNDQKLRNILCSIELNAIYSYRLKEII